MSRYLMTMAVTLVLAVHLNAQGKKPDTLERHVNKALHFLKSQQERDGAWRLSGKKSTGATALAVMSFMSAGHVPGEGPYGKTVQDGISWVLKSQKTSGLLSTADHAMYEHGITTLMLAEVMGMTDAKLAPKVKTALEKAVRLILLAQRKGGNNDGGWRYQPSGYDADVSVTGWQLLALKAAKNVGCDVPAKRIDRALQFLKRCRDLKSGGYRYLPYGQLTVACTGTGILCVELCDKHHSPDALRAGAYLLRNPPAWTDFHFFYTIYYCSQATFQLGGNYWAFYRPRLHKAVLSNQRPDGGWNNKQNYYGDHYSTAMTVLALTVEYRYLPIYQRSEDTKKKAP